MHRFAPTLVLSALVLACQAAPPAPPPDTGEVTPFRLGTFERSGTSFVGVVLGESLVLDLPAANALLGASGPAVASPSDMNDLIERYDEGLRARIGEVVRAASGPGARPAWAHDIATLRVLPPVMPLTMLNVAVNYREHDIEMATVRAGAPGLAAPTGGEALPGTTSAPGIWERAEDDPRWNPYMFLKAPAAIIAHGEAIRIPPGRERIEWECELAVVIGRRATAVPTERANDHIFGYTLQNDVSDRGGRGDTRYSSDWLVTKSHDTFAPLGPFITPKEFVPDVHDLTLSFSLNDETLQEGHTSAMIHTVPELVAYASNLLTLRPGDVIATGTPPGSGSARTPPVFFRDGDVSVCTYERIGTLTNPIEGSGA